MKKILSMGLIVATSFLVGCGVSKTIEAESNDINFSRVNKDGYIQIYKDKETGVNYILYADSYKAGLCPRYRANGQLYVD